MRHVTCAFAVLMFVKCAVAAPDTSSWLRFKSEEGGFAIEFPLSPHTSRVDTPCRTCSEMETVEVRTNVGDFGIMHFSYGGQFSLEGGRDGALKNLRATLRNEQRFVLLGEEALDTTFDSPQGAGRVVLVTHASRAYMVYYYAPQGREIPPDATRFLESFKFLDDAAPVAATPSAPLGASTFAGIANYVDRAGSDVTVNNRTLLGALGFPRPTLSMKTVETPGSVVALYAVNGEPELLFLKDARGTRRTWRVNAAGEVTRAALFSLEGEGASLHTTEVLVQRPRSDDAELHAAIRSWMARAAKRP